MTVRGGNGDQLRMFVQAKELPSFFPADVDVPGYVPKHKPVAREKALAVGKERMWEKKQADNIRSGLAESVAREGVREPIEVGPTAHFAGGGWGKGAGPTDMAIVNGHHRAIAAMRSNPESYVPLVHHRNYDDMFNYKPSE